MSVLFRTTKTSSRYLDNLRNKRDSETQIKIQPIRNYYSSEKELIRSQYAQYRDSTVYDINKKIRNIESEGCWSYLGCGLAIVICIILFGFYNGILYKKYEIIFGFPIVVFFLVKVFGKRIDKNKVKSLESEKKQKIDLLNAEEKQKIKLLNAEEEQKIKIIVDENQNILETEELEFKRKVDDAYKKFGKHYNDPRLGQSIKKVSKYLESRFSDSIRLADHSQQIKSIIIRFSFVVSKSNITMESWQIQNSPNIEQKKIHRHAEEYIFYNNSIPELPEFIDQIGLARVIARILQQRMKIAFPYDPSDKVAKIPSDIKIEYNDNLMILTYTGSNGKYIPISAW